MQTGSDLLSEDVSVTNREKIKARRTIRITDGKQQLSDSILDPGEVDGSQQAQEPAKNVATLFERR